MFCYSDRFLMSSRTSLCIFYVLTKTSLHTGDASANWIKREKLLMHAARNMMNNFDINCMILSVNEALLC